MRLPKLVWGAPFCSRRDPSTCAGFVQTSTHSCYKKHCADLRTYCSIWRGTATTDQSRVRPRDAGSTATGFAGLDHLFLVGGNLPKVTVLETGVDLALFLASSLIVIPAFSSSIGAVAAFRWAEGVPKRWVDVTVPADGMALSTHLRGKM